jgi:Phage major capsid protein E/Phage terminase large subunit (GpA)
MDDHDGADAIERAWRDGLKPDPLLTVSEWADRYRVLSQRASSEPGRWRTERTPYLREIMDCLSPSSPVQRVALMKGAQIGGDRARQLLDRPRDPPGARADDGCGAHGGACQARGSFEYAGLLFEEYRGKIGSVDFTDASKAYFFPVGVPGLFRQYNAPADFVETANTIGLPRYAKQAVDQQFARWVMLHVQSNPLPICTRPRVLIKGKRT